MPDADGSLPATPTFDADNYPDCAFYEVFLRCDTHTLSVLPELCPRFKALLSDNFFWMEKCQRDGKAIPTPQLRKEIAAKGISNVFDYKTLWRNDPFGSNLAPLHLEEPTSMDIISTTPGITNRGVFMVEEPPEGLPSDRFPKIDRCIKTLNTGAYGHFHVTVKLADKGIEDWVMDELRPLIEVQLWVAPSLLFAYSCSNCNVSLWAEEPVDDKSHSPISVSDINVSMHKLEWRRLVYRNNMYGRGVRYIRFTFAGIGQSSALWHRGMRFANIEMRAILWPLMNYGGAVAEEVGADRHYEKVEKW